VDKTPASSPIPVRFEPLSSDENVMASRLCSRFETIGVLAALLFGAVWGVGAAPASASWASPTPDARRFYGEPVDYTLVFPVGGPDIYYADDDLLGFGACRGGCSRPHEGVDILAPKMTPVFAAAAGTVAWLGSECCSVFLRHDDGWMTWYIHLNNDTPGTDDGLGWGIADGIVPGVRVDAGQLIGWVGDSGNAEDSSPHLHFELMDSNWVKVDPYPALRMAQGNACTRQVAAPLGALLAAGPALRLGSLGEAVSELQGFLAVRGYRVGVIDGILGRATERAVRVFQRSRGLEADGVVGAATRGAITAYAQLPAFSSLTNPDGRILGPGMRGPDIAELKRWLRAAGYDPGPRPFTGWYDALTESAVRSFQQASGIAADGTVESSTRAALMAALSLLGHDVCR
jgi:peptidoglycan hydrolase-like protein with peptidoglycan-binding domain